MIAGTSSFATGALKTLIILSTSLVHALLGQGRLVQDHPGRVTEQAVLLDGLDAGTGRKVRSAERQLDGLRLELHGLGGWPGAASARSPRAKRTGRIARDMIARDMA